MASPTAFAALRRRGWARRSHLDVRGRAGRRRLEGRESLQRSGLGEAGDRRPLGLGASAKPRRGGCSAGMRRGGEQLGWGVIVGELYGGFRVVDGTISKFGGSNTDFCLL